MWGFFLWERVTLWKIVRISSRKADIQEVPVGLAVKGFNVDVNAVDEKGYTTLWVFAATPGDFYLYVLS